MYLYIFYYKATISPFNFSIFCSLLRDKIILWFSFFFVCELLELTFTIFHIEPAEESLCGNGRVDPGEDCDGGFLGRIGQNNKCCTQDCQFTTAAICRYAYSSEKVIGQNNKCCTQDCKIIVW